MEKHLMHFGIKGQKWGVRRFQNQDGTLTAEGRRRYLTELKADRKAAFEAGRSYTVAYNAEQRAKRKFDKTNSDLDKDTYNSLKKQRETSQRTVENLHREMVKKYGKDNVKDIAYRVDRNGNLVPNERVESGAEIVASIGLSVGVTALFRMSGIPMVFISEPQSLADRGRAMYREERTNQIRAAKNSRNK